MMQLPQQQQPIYNQPQGQGGAGNAMDMFRTQMRAQLGFPPSLPAGSANPAPASPFLGGMQHGMGAANSSQGPYGGQGNSSYGPQDSGVGNMQHAPGLGLPPQHPMGLPLLGGMGGYTQPHPMQPHPLLGLDGSAMPMMGRAPIPVRR